MARITTHPGEMLKEEFMVPLGLSARALAKAIDVPANRVTALVKGERGMTADTALRLASFFDMSADFWMNLQHGHELSKAREERATEYRSIRPIGAPALADHAS